MTYTWTEHTITCCSCGCVARVAQESIDAARRDAGWDVSATDAEIAERGLDQYCLKCIDGTVAPGEVVRRTYVGHDLPPELPIERRKIELVYLVDPRANSGHMSTASRFALPNRESHHDIVHLDASYTTDVGSMNQTFSLSPAMIVHLANEMLTDNERAHIAHPAIASEAAYKAFMQAQGARPDGRCGMTDICPRCAEPITDATTARLDEETGEVWHADCRQSAEDSRSERAFEATLSGDSGPSGVSYERAMLDAGRGEALR